MPCVESEDLLALRFGFRVALLGQELAGERKVLLDERGRFEGVLGLLQEAHQLGGVRPERQQALGALDRFAEPALGHELLDPRDAELELGLHLLGGHLGGEHLGPVGGDVGTLGRARRGGSIEISQQEGGHADALPRLLALGIDCERLFPGVNCPLVLSVVVKGGSLR